MKIVLWFSASLGVRTFCAPPDAMRMSKEQRWNSEWKFFSSREEGKEKATQKKLKGRYEPETAFGCFVMGLGQP